MFYRRIITFLALILLFFEVVDPSTAFVRANISPVRKTNAQLKKQDALQSEQSNSTTISSSAQDDSDEYISHSAISTLPILVFASIGVSYTFESAYLDKLSSFSWSILRPPSI